MTVSKLNSLSMSLVLGQSDFSR